MSIEGISRVQSRLAEIESRIARLRGGGSSTMLGWGPGLNGAGAISSAASTFGQAYQVALDDQASSQALSSAYDLSDDMFASSSSVRVADVRSPGQYGRLEPPAELLAYGNGRIPASALGMVGIGQHRLYRPAAEAFRRMRAAAAADGVVLDITDSYRSYDQQVDVANRKGLYSQGGLAATPGTSNHGWGMAIDVDVDDAGQSWLRANGARYGWVESVPREPWHWEFRPSG